MTPVAIADIFRARTEMEDAVARQIATMTEFEKASAYLNARETGWTSDTALRELDRSRTRADWKVREALTFHLLHLEGMRETAARAMTGRR